MSNLKKIIPFKGTLKILESGLRIGGSAGSAGIGEMDNPIIRHPITRTPYVPGSSIKGKIRSLLEIKRGYKNYRGQNESNDGKPCQCGFCEICQLFGCGDINRAKSPTRVIFRDCYPDEKTSDLWDKYSIDSDEKTEVTIDRRNMKANPRSMERIPADSTFDFAFSFRVFEQDDTRKLLDALAEGFELLEQDYLGGSGSRGYGHIAIVEKDGKSMNEFLKKLIP